MEGEAVRAPGRSEESGPDPATVLVADDEEALRRYLVRAIAAMGFPAVGVATEEDLVQALDVRAPALVLLDWHLPGTPASELVEQLTSRAVPVVVITGDPEGVDGVRVPVLGKPIDTEQLRRHIEEAFGDAGR